MALSATDHPEIGLIAPVKKVSIQREIDYQRLISPLLAATKEVQLIGWSIGKILSTEFCCCLKL